ncbi:MAG: hypothetical protein AAB573_03460 [Patescibacteria group bacterium]
MESPRARYRGQLAMRFEEIGRRGLVEGVRVQFFDGVVNGWRDGYEITVVSPAGYISARHLKGGDPVVSRDPRYFLKSGVR